MIVARNEQERRKALAKLLPMQKNDFKGIYEVMGGQAGHHQTVGSAST